MEKFYLNLVFLLVYNKFVSASMMISLPWIQHHIWKIFLKKTEISNTAYISKKNNL